jgi:DNA polymerase III subunit beta
MPVLGNILLEAKNNQLRLAATNREIGINCWIAAKVEDEGAITVPARLLSEFVNSLPAEWIDMELITRTQTLHFKCAGFKANLKGIDWQEFPILPTLVGMSPTDGQYIALDAGTLTAMIGGVVVAASDDENRPTLTGVEITIGAGQITMAATDGYRLGYRRENVSLNDDATTVIVPHTALESLSKFLPDAAGAVECVITDNRAMMIFSWAGNEKARYQRVEMSCQLIDGKYPDYRATVPKKSDITIKVDTKALANAIKLALLFGRDNANLVRFESFADANGNDGQLKISAHSAEMGETDNAIPCLADGALSIAFNGKLVLDALATITDERTIIELTQNNRPGVFYGGSVRKDDAFAVLMPMSPK